MNFKSKEHLFLHIIEHRGSKKLNHLKAATARIVEIAPFSLFFHLFFFQFQYKVSYLIDKINLAQYQ